MRLLMTALSALFLFTANHASAVTVDIDARVNSGSGSGPFVSLTLDAGHYEVSAIKGQFTALSAWSSNLGCDTNGANCTQGWFVSYDIFDSSNNLLLSYDSTPEIFSTPDPALADAQLDGSQKFTLAAAGTILIGVLDNFPSDNRGGVSLSIVRAPDVPTVPLPASGLLLMGGVALLAVRRKKMLAN